MTPRTFCRFRQTSRKIDSLIEANRFRISARTKVAQLSFLMSVDYLNPNVHRFQVFSGHVLQILDLHVKLDQRREEGLLNIEDPYKQLSGIGFDFILIQFVRNNNPFTTRDDLSAIPTMEQTFADNICPVVERMKLECEWLAFNECTLATWFIPLIRFSKFFVGHFPIPYAIFLTLDLSHCFDVVVAVIRDQPECETICQMVGNARRANFMFDQNVDVLDVLGDFLREIRRDRKNVRNLENSHLQALQSSFDDFNPPELNQIWKGQIHSGVRLPVRTHRILLSGRIASTTGWQSFALIRLKSTSTLWMRLAAKLFSHAFIPKCSSLSRTTAAPFTNGFWKRKVTHKLWNFFITAFQMRT